MRGQQGAPGGDLLGGPWGVGGWGGDIAQEKCGFQDRDRTVFPLAISDGNFDVAKITRGHHLAVVDSPAALCLGADGQGL